MEAVRLDDVALEAALDGFLPPGGSSTRVRQPSLVVPLKQSKDEDILDLPNMILPEFDLEEEWSSLQPLEEWANTPLSALLVDRSPDLG